MKKIVWIGVIAILLLVLLPGAAAATITATLTLKASDGVTGIAGAQGSYKLGATTYYFGSPTDASGSATQVFPDGTTYVEVWVTYHNGASAHVTQDISVAPPVTFTFQTVKVTLRLETCGGTPIDGGLARYGPGAVYTTTWFPDGAGKLTGFNGPGQVDGQLFPGTYSFEMTYLGTADQKLNRVITGDTTITWQTTAVTLQYSGSISYGGGTGDSRWFKQTPATATVELLPGTYKFHFRTGYRLDLTISGCTMAKTLAVLRLKDHNGVPLAGGTARGGYTTPTVWHVSGSTDSNGILLDLRDGTPSQLTYEMKVNNVVAVDGPQDPSVDSFFDFQTILLTLRLETCPGVGLPGGNPRYGMGATYTTWWFPGGVTDANGETSAEFFPGTYSFEMLYAATADQKISVTILNADTKLTWKTTKVTLYNSGLISYGGPVGDSTWFTKPSTELLPGVVKFHFRDGGVSGGVTDLTISGCEMKKFVNVLLLKDHNGAPLAGGRARGGFGSNYAGWWVPGLTDANGVLLDIRTAASQPTTMSYEMSYSNTPKVITQDVSTNSLFVFQTSLLTLRLEQCDYTPINGGRARYGKGSTYTTWWFPGGLTGSSAAGETQAEFFPGTYSFEMQYQGTVGQTIAIPLPAKMTWQTTAVTLAYPGAISYGGPTGQSAWFTKPTMQLLEGIPTGAPYRFHFQNPEGGRLWLSWSGCTFSGDVRTVDLVPKVEGPPGTWTQVPGGSGKVTLLRGGGAYEMIGSGLAPTTSYSLIYYPDPWPGTGLKVINTGSSLADGSIALSGTFAFNTIPIGGDTNAPNAKIWLILSADTDGTKMTAWNPGSYLFEVNLLGP